MHSERALLLARVLLLLHLVRGAHGVVEVASVISGKRLLRNFMDDEISQKTWKLLAKAVRERLKKIKKKRPYLAHSEGLIAGYSGYHPLHCLANSGKARAAFDAIARIWSITVVRCCCKGYTLTSPHVVDLWKAVRGKAPLAMRSGVVCSAGQYTAMSLGRSFAQLLPFLFGRAASDMDETLYSCMRQGQSKIAGAVIADDAVEASADVFEFFHIAGIAEFRRLLKLTKKASQNQRCSSLRSQSEDGVTWQTLLVHLCEIKQVLKKYGLKQIRSLLVAVLAADVATLVQIRSDHKALMKRAYAGGSMCHAVYMVRQAGRRLQVKLEICAEPVRSSTTKIMQALVIDFAKTQLSPKLNVRCIPEWVSMQSNAHALYIKCVALTPADLVCKDKEEIRRLYVSRGLRGVRARPRHELLVAIHDEPKVARPPPVLELYKCVRNAGGNPQPFVAENRQSWSRLQCRSFLLRKRSRSELRLLLPLVNKKRRLNKCTLIKRLLVETNAH